MTINSATKPKMALRQNESTSGENVTAPPENKGKILLSKGLPERHILLSANTLRYVQKPSNLFFFYYSTKIQEKTHNEKEFAVFLKSHCFLSTFSTAKKKSNEIITYNSHNKSERISTFGMKYIVKYICTDKKDFPKPIKT